MAWGRFGGAGRGGRKHPRTVGQGGHGLGVLPAGAGGMGGRMNTAEPGAAEQASESAPVRRRGWVNEDRALRAARRDADAARVLLAKLAVNGVKDHHHLSATPVWRRRWIEVLQVRAANADASLADLAATMDPPMTKSAFAGQLRRAFRFAGEFPGAPTHGSPADDDPGPNNHAAESAGAPLRPPACP